MLNVDRKKILITIGWALVHTHVLFNALISEGNRLPFNLVIVIFLASVFSSTLLERTEISLKIWMLSIISSVLLTLIIMAAPSLSGVIDRQLMTILISGSIQPIFVVLLLTTPLDLLGCFLGRVIRNRLKV